MAFCVFSLAIQVTVNVKQICRPGLSPRWRVSLRFLLWSTTVPGVARRLGTFFCFAKRKYPKKRRPRFAAPLGCPALLADDGGCGTRARSFHRGNSGLSVSPSDSPRRNLRRRLRCSAALMGPRLGERCLQFAKVKKECSHPGLGPGSNFSSTKFKTNWASDSIRGDKFPLS